MPVYDDETVARFWSKVDVKSDAECWPFLGGHARGYGHFSVRRKTHKAHRMAWEIANDAQAPSGLMTVVMHLCNNKSCCNPSHLKLGTAAENTRSAHDDGLAYGRPGERHHNARLTLDQVRTIRADARSGAQIAAEYGVSSAHINGIKNGRFWKDKSNAA